MSEKPTASEAYRVRGPEGPRRATGCPAGPLGEPGWDGDQQPPRKYRRPLYGDELASAILWDMAPGWFVYGLVCGLLGLLIGWLLWRMPA